MYYLKQCILIKMVTYMQYIPSWLFAVRLASNNFGTVVELDCQHNTVMQTNGMVHKTYYKLRTFNPALGSEISCQ